MTAGAGTVGRAVVAEAQRVGHEVTVLDTRLLDAPVRQIFGRAADPDALAQALEGATAVIHLEWKGAVREATQDPFGTQEHNLSAALSVALACAERRIPLAFASTAPYVGDRPEPSAEGDPVNRRSLYFAQKLYAENLLEALAASHGLVAVALRIFNVYGPGGRPGQILNRLADAIEVGTPIRLTGVGRQVRDFIAVEDVARALLAALAPEAAGPPMNIGTGVGTSMIELAEHLMRVAGSTVPIEFVAAPPEESRYLIADPAEAHRRIGFRARIRLEEELPRWWEARRAAAFR